MSYIKPPHHTIPGNGPPNFNKVWDIDVTCHIIPGADDAPVQIFFSKIYTKGSHSERHQSDFIAAIPGDAEINLRLAGYGRRCRWSPTFLAVTAKDDYAAYMGGIRMVGNEIKFKVKSNTGTQVHHFLNLNVDLNIGTAGGAPVWKAVTIDPDVINPRPPGRLTGDRLMPLIITTEELANELRAAGVEALEIIVAPPPANGVPMIQVPDI